MVHDPLHRGFPLDAQPLSRLMPFIGEDAIVQVLFLQIGHVDEGHTSRIEAEEEQVAGEAFLHIAQADMLDASHLVDSECPLVGLGVSGVYMSEGVAVDGHALFHSPVIDGPDDAHIEGNGIHREVLQAQEGLKTLHHLTVDLCWREVFVFSEDFEFIQRSAVGLTGPRLPVVTQPCRLLLEEGKERSARFREL